MTHESLTNMAAASSSRPVVPEVFQQQSDGREFFQETESFPPTLLLATDVKVKYSWARVKTPIR